MVAVVAVVVAVVCLYVYMHVVAAVVKVYKCVMLMVQSLRSTQSPQVGRNVSASAVVACADTVTVVAVVGVVLLHRVWTRRVRR